MKVSIIMPLALVDSFFEKTVTSIEAQTFRDFELVIVCLGGMVDRVKRQLTDANVTFRWRVIETRLRGVAFAANLGLSQSDAKYIARWDCDDLCDSNRLEEQVAFLDVRPDVAVVGTRVKIIDEVDLEIPFKTFKFFENDAAIRRALKYRQPLLHSALLFRSEILYSNCGYLYGHTSEDHELFIRIARNKSIKFHNLKNVVTYYRRHSGQLSDITHIRRHFYEISAFMFSEFLRTLNPLYLVGVFANFPPVRRFRYVYRSIRVSLSKRGRAW